MLKAGRHEEDSRLGGSYVGWRLNHVVPREGWEVPLAQEGDPKGEGLRREGTCGVPCIPYPKVVTGDGGVTVEHFRAGCSGVEVIIKIAEQAFIGVIIRRGQGPLRQQPRQWVRRLVRA